MQSWIPLLMAVAYSAQSGPPQPATRVDPARLAQAALEAQEQEADNRFPRQFTQLLDRRSSTQEAIRKLAPTEQAKAIQFLSNQLTKGNPKRKGTTVQLLASLGKLADPALPLLLDAASSPDLGLREKAINALQSLGGLTRPEDQQKVLTSVLAELKSTEPRTRMRGALTAAALGSTAKGATEPLLALLKDPQVEVQAAAIFALCSTPEHGPLAAPKLIEILNGGDRWLQGVVARSIGRLGGPARGAVPGLITLLKDKDSAVRSSARNSLVQLRGTDPGLIDAVSQVMATADAGPRAEAALLLASIGTPAKAALPALLNALGDPEPEVRMNVANALTTITADEPTQPTGELMDLLKSSEPHERRGAAMTLGRLGKKAEPALSRLTRALEDTDPDTRAAAGAALSELNGIIDPQAMLSLVRGTESDAVRRSALGVIGRMGARAKLIVPDLQQLLKKDYPAETRAALVQALGQIGAAQTAENLGPIRDLLDSSDSRLRLSAVTALAGFGCRTPDCVSLFMKALKDTDARVRESSAATLAFFSEAAKPAVRGIASLISDPEPAVSRRASMALSQLKEQAAEAVPLLAEIVADPKRPRTMRILAVKTLAKMEDAGRVALPTLHRVFENKKENELLRAHAAFALRLIGGLPAPLHAKVEALLESKRQYFKEVEF